jgi:hypothetical protein
MDNSIDNSIINKNNIINFFKYLENNNTLQENKLIENEILKYYNIIQKIIIINTTQLINIIKKFGKNTLITSLCLLFRNKKIEYPFVHLSIPFNLLNNTLIAIFKNTNVKKLSISNSLEHYEFILDIPLDHLEDYPDNFNINYYKNNLNYFLINYFAEIDILNCKRKNNFITPLTLIYSKNNFLEQLFLEIIDTNQEINSSNIKMYLKKKIAFCLYNNIIHLILIIKHIVDLNNINNNNLNILNFGIDWGEWIILAHLFKEFQFQSYYLNNLSQITINNINKSFEKNNNIIQQPFTNDLLNNNLGSNYSILFINLDFIFNFYLDKQFKINDILDSKISPILKSVNSNYIVLQNYLNLDNYTLINYFTSNFNNFKFEHNITINQSIYSIFSSIL